MAIRLWDLATGHELNQLMDYPGGIYSIAFSPDGKLLAGGSEDNAIRFWDVVAGRPLRTLAGHTGRVQCVAFSSDGRVLASCSQDQTVRLWSVDSGKQLCQLQGHRGWVNSLTFSSQDQTLASGGKDETIRVWDTLAARQIGQLVHNSSVEAVAAAPDGSLIASGNWDRSVYIWDIASLSRIAKLTEHRGGIKSIAFSPDGKLLASGSGDATIILWDVAAKKRLRQLRGHDGVVLAVRFSADGLTLASGSSDCVIRLWETATGKPLSEFRGHKGLVASIAFAPNGKTLASASTGGSVEVQQSFDLPRVGRPVFPALLPANVGTLWSDLGDPDLRKALRASRALSASPAQCLPLFRMHLQPVPPLDAPRKTDLIARLMSRIQSEREQAVLELEGLGDCAEGFIRDILARNPTPEVRQSLEQLLERLKKSDPSPETLRGLRAVEVLSRIGTPPSLQLLDALSRGAPDALLTNAARAALERISRS